LRHDAAARFQFAPLQSAFAKQQLARHQVLPPSPDTMYLIEGHDTAASRLLTQADAALEVLAGLGGAWWVVAALARLAPRPLRNAAYSAVAANRYRWGRHTTCAVPRPEWRDRFIEVA
jgi:predicted DCC family thiol-disulfide oxidoreductase YuxK